MAKKYRKRLVDVEAVRWDGENKEEILEFIGDAQETNFDPELSIKTLEGWHCASVGDYIIKGVNGEFYPCKPDIFDKTYISVELGNGVTCISVVVDEDGTVSLSRKGSDIDVLAAWLSALRQIFTRSENKELFKKAVPDMLPIVFAEDEEQKPKRRIKTGTVVLFLLFILNLVLGNFIVRYGTFWLGSTNLVLAGAVFTCGVYDLILNK